MLQQPFVSPRSLRVSSEVSTSISSYFLRPDVSVMMPGRKDNVIVRKDGVKEVLQKRYLTTSLKEAYAQFVAENGKVVSLAYFCQQRPPHVVTFGEIPHNICACRLHEDFIS